MGDSEVINGVGGGLETELTTIRRSLFAAGSSGEVIKLLKREVLPLLEEDDDGDGGGEGKVEPVSRPLTRALCLLLVEVAISASANDYRAVTATTCELVQSALKNKGRWPLLPEVLATVLTGALPRCTFSQSRLAALKLWTVLLHDAAKAMGEQVAGSDIFVKATAAQAALLEGLETTGSAQHKRAGLAEIHRLLAMHVKVLPQAYTARVIAPAQAATHQWLATAVVSFYRSMPTLKQAYEEGGVKREFLEAYVRDVISAKVKPSPEVLASYEPLLASVVGNDMADVLAPSVEKAIRKSPAGVLGAVASLAAQLQLDLGPYVDTLFLPPALRMIKSVEDESRGHAVSLLNSIAEKISDSNVLFRIVQETSNTLLGKSGVLAQWFQRHAVVTCLHSLSRTARKLPRASVEPAAAAAVEGLVAALAKEAHEGTRTAMLTALGDWLSLTNKLPPEGLEAFKKGLTTGSKDTTLAYLLALREAVTGSGSNVGIRDQLDALLDALNKVASEGGKRAGQANIEALVALQLLTELGQSDAALNKYVTDTGSWLYAPALFDAIALPANTSAGLSFVRVLFGATRTLGVESVLGIPGETLEEEGLGVRNVKPAARALLELLLNPSKAVRTEATEALTAILREDATVTTTMLKAMWVKVDEVARKLDEARKPVKDTSDESAPGKTVKTPSWPVPQRFAAALLAMVPEGSGVVNLPMALVLVHHPAVAAAPKATSVLWSRLVARFGGVDHVVQCLDDVSVEISDEIFEAVLSELWAHRVAGQQAMAGLALSLGDEGRALLAEGIVPALLIQLQRPELSEITEKEVAIYFHLPGSVYQTSSLGEGKADKGGSAAAAQDRRMRTGKRQQLYDSDAEKWEQEYKKKKAAEKANANSSQGPSPEEARLLAEEAEIRAKIGGIRGKALACLEAITELAHLVQPVAHACIPEAVPALAPLIRSRLLTDGAYATLCALASTIESAAQPVAWDMAAAVRLVFLTESDTDKEAVAKLAPVADVFNRCVDYLSGLCSEVYKERLSGPTFALTLPILRAVLMDRIGHSPSYTDALSILSAHARLAEANSEPPSGLGVGPSEAELLRPLRRSMIEIVLYALRVHSRADPDPAEVLGALMTGPALSAGEWAPLLGNGGLLCEEMNVRLAVMNSIQAMLDTGATLTGNPLLESRLWLLKLDDDADVHEVAEAVWTKRGAPLSTTYASPLVVLLTHERTRVRAAAARAIGYAMIELPDTATSTLTRLVDLYKENLPKEKEEVKINSEDYFLKPPGHEEDEEAASKEQEKWVVRSGVAAALEEIGKAGALAPEGDGDHLETVFGFVLQLGIVDRNDSVRQQMVSAGMALIDTYGTSHAAAFLPILEDVLEQPHGRGEDVRVFDWRREGTVVLMGSTAKHLDKTDPKILTIMDRLVEALSTPSESVQRAVALCMVPLMPAVKASAGELAEKLLKAALKGDSYAQRRGGAYGISALVKGLGIASLKQHGIMSAVEAAGSGTNVPAKQGALFCIECLCERLKLLFEPYVIVTLPLLLRCFSDSSDHVRDAAILASKAVMGNLSPHGVKLVLPTILKALDDSAWRSKAAALNLLGAMAYCAPKQLSSCLPQIVPRMTDAFSDTHPKVRESGKSALGDIGKVVRNPEIRKLSPLLLSALHDPTKNTKDALDGLLNCEFMHSVDAPSLALLIPIIQRGLKDRTADTKRKSSLITGNMCSMVQDAKDLVPYLSAVLPGLKSALVDPIPDVRATAARALGSLMRGMGEDLLYDLVPWLVDTLKAEASPVERSGGAQGLAQVLVSLGDARVRQVLGDLLALRGHPRYAVREGVLWVLSFLPSALGQGFTPYLSDTLPVILAGLTDEVDSVREVALRAGQVLVATHGKHHADALLPSLEDGLFDDSWRIRQSSVQLLGDLLYTIGGTKAVGFAGGDEDDEGGLGSRGVSRAEIAINSVLGGKRRAKILASLYVIRNDTSAAVRQSALQVWKSVVSNTPRVLREVLPTLVEIIISALASNNLDKRTVAGRALGDIVRKLGDHILPEIVPHLRKELEAGDTNMRQGVCLGLAEIMDCASKTQIQEFASTLVTAIIDALGDRSVAVREQAGIAFSAFYRVIGPDAIAEVVPPMLKNLEKEQLEGNGAAQGRALLGVKELLRARPREVLSYLLPRLTRAPVSTSAARTLEAVAEVAGPSLHSHVSTLLPLLIGQLVEANDEVKDAEEESEEKREKQERLDALQSCARSIVVVVDAAAMQYLVVDMTKLLESDDGRTRRWAAWLISALASGTRADLDQQAPIILKFCLPMLNDPDPDVLPSVTAALAALVEKLTVEKALQHLDFMRNVVASMVSDARRRKGGVGDAEFFLPGLNVPKGLDPFIGVYSDAILKGSTFQKELAATFMGELVVLMTPTAIKPYVNKVVGPLIRLANDRTFPHPVKVAFLTTIGLLLEKTGPNLRPLAPQLQTTFIKALTDPTPAVRDRAVAGLGRLMPLTTRIDPLVGELVTGASAAGPGGQVDVQAAMLDALAQVLAAAGAKVTPPAITKALDQLSGLWSHEDDGVRAAAALAGGRALVFLPDDGLATIMGKSLLGDGGEGGRWTVRHGKAMVLGHFVRMGDAARLQPYLPDILSVLRSDLRSDHVPVREAALDGVSAVLGKAIAAGDDVGRLLETFVGDAATALNDDSPDVRKAAAVLVKRAAKAQPAAVRPHLNLLVPPLMARVQDNMDIRNKYVTERALVYILEIHTRPETLNEFVAKAEDKSVAKFAWDYAKRVLVKLASSSDDES